jgi:hypothetical protein
MIHAVHYCMVGGFQRCKEVIKKKKLTKPLRTNSNSRKSSSSLHPVFLEREGRHRGRLSELWRLLVNSASTCRDNSCTFGRVVVVVVSRLRRTGMSLIVRRDDGEF